MYRAAVDYWESRGCESGPEEIAHLGVITALRKICNHPSLVRPRQSQQLPGEVQNHINCRLIRIMPLNQITIISEHIHCHVQAMVNANILSSQMLSLEVALLSFLSYMLMLYGFFVYCVSYR